MPSSTNRHIDTSRRNPRARVRLLTGSEPCERSAIFGDYFVEWAGWRPTDIARAYRDHWMPSADWLVRVTAPDGQVYVMIGRDNPLPSPRAVCQAIGSNVSAAFRRRPKNDDKPVSLDDAIHAELLRFINTVTEIGTMA